MKPIINTILPAFLLLSSYGYAGEITKEQCKEYKMYETLDLTEANKKKVEDSCKKRYSSDNALGNCTVFEGEDYRKELNKLAKKECK